MQTSQPASSAIVLKKLTFSQEIAAKLFAGSIAGVTGVSLCYPLDFAKTRLQKPMPGEPKYGGMFEVLSVTRAKHGMGGWYKGLPSNLTGIIPEKGLKLAVNDIVRDALRDSQGKVHLRGEVVAAVSAAVAQVLVTTPMEIVKIRCQLSGSKMWPIIRQLGLRGMYKGYVSTLTRDVWFNLLFFPLQSKLKAAAVTPQTPEAYRFFYSFACGIFAGMVAASLSTPMDVVKTRLQAGDAGNMVSVASGIVSTQGPSALFLGWQPRVCAIAPLFGIAICVFDLQKRYLVQQGYDVPM
eukprot:gene12287-18993_t